MPARRKSDARSVEAQSWRAWYGTARWRRIAKVQLAAHPLCAMCQTQGRVTAAITCDHIDPHKGDPVKFWVGPFQSLCTSCHSSGKQRDEARGYTVGNDATGRPISPDHPWNR
jgi:hypothetical protein